jgi:outer membrane lipoprotein-sorting protein
MTIFARRPALRWLVPLLAVVLLGTAGSVVAAISANARDSLPPRTASQLLVDVQKARLEGLSGTVVQTADLGLPELPGPAGQNSPNFTSLVSGSHTLRVWYAGPEQARIALLGQLGESDVLRNGSDVWVWSSHDNTAKHMTAPAHAAGNAAGNPAATAPEDQAVTPQQAAQKALDAITPTTAVSTDPTAEVAGRPAYQLVLEPKDPATLVGKVTIAMDGATHIPTRVQVFAAGGSKPSFEVGFTSFDPTTPSVSVFEFNPPPGATVTEGLMGQGATAKGDAPAGTDESRADRPDVVGSGWSSVVTTTLPHAPSAPPNTSGDSGDSEGSRPLSIDSIVKSLPAVSGAWGSGHLLRGTLFSVVVTHDGRVAAGAVEPERLYAVLAAQ